MEIEKEVAEGVEENQEGQVDEEGNGAHELCHLPLFEP